MSGQLGHQHLQTSLPEDHGISISAGLPEELIQKGKDAKSVTEIKQTGNHFEITVTTGPKVLHNAFTIGEETEVETLTDEKVKVGM